MKPKISITVDDNKEAIATCYGNKEDIQKAIIDILTHSEDHYILLGYAMIKASDERVKLNKESPEFAKVFRDKIALNELLSNEEGAAV